MGSRRTRNEDRVSPPAWGNLHVWHSPLRQQLTAASWNDYGPDGRVPTANVVPDERFTYDAGPPNAWLGDGSSDYYTYDGATGWGDFKRTDQWRFFIVVSDLGTGADSTFWSKMEANGTRKGITWHYDDSAHVLSMWLETGSIPNRCLGYVSVDLGDALHVIEWSYDASQHPSGFGVWIDGVAQTVTPQSDTLSASIQTTNDAEIGRQTESPSGGGPINYFGGALYFFTCFAVSGGAAPMLASSAHRFQRQLLRRFAP